MYRSTIRLVLVLVGVLALLAGLALVIAWDEEDPPFTRSHVGVASGDAEGLLGDRLARRRSIPGSTLEPGTATVVSGPGSIADEFVVVRLNDDVPAVRVRQRTSEGLGGSSDSPVRWQGWVAAQRSSLEGDGVGRAVPAGRRVGTWRPAGADGVLVRPGEQVRLATRFDLAPPQRGDCHAIVLEDGPLWFWREDGDTGPWKRLRAAGLDGLDHDVRTGNTGRIRFASAPHCGPDSVGDTHDVDPDASVSR